MLDLPAICRAAFEISDDSFFIPEALVFGSDDFCADIGATRTETATELVFARQYLVTAAKAFGLQVGNMGGCDLRHQDICRVFQAPLSFMHSQHPHNPPALLFY